MTDNPFEKTLDRLREKGWQQGGYGRQTGPNCLVGGVKAVLGMSPSKRLIGFLEVNYLNDIIMEHYADRAINGSMTHVPNFNDHPDTTFDDIERVLEKAAVKWEEDRVLRDD